MASRCRQRRSWSWNFPLHSPCTSKPKLYSPIPSCKLQLATCSKATSAVARQLQIKTKLKDTQIQDTKYTNWQNFHRKKQNANLFFFLPNSVDFQGDFQRWASAEAPPGRKFVAAWQRKMNGNFARNLATRAKCLWKTLITVDVYLVMVRSKLIAIFLQKKKIAI